MVEHIRMPLPCIPCTQINMHEYNSQATEHHAGCVFYVAIERKYSTMYTMCSSEINRVALKATVHCVFWMCVFSLYIECAFEF